MLTKKLLSWLLFVPLTASAGPLISSNLYDATDIEQTFLQTAGQREGLA